MSGRTLGEDLRARAAEAPQREAVVAGDARATYAQLDAAADRFAAALLEAGVARGDRVLLVLPNRLEAAVAVYGVLRTGAAISPLNPTIKAGKLAYVVKDSGAAALVADASTAAVATEAGGRRAGAGGRRARARPPAGAAARGRSRRGHLHVGLDRRTEGRDAHPPQHDLRRRLDRRVPRPARGRPRAVHVPAVLRLRALPAADVHPGRRDARARARLRLPGADRPAASRRARHRPARRADALQ